MSVRAPFLLTAVAALLAAPAGGQDKKPEQKPAPKYDVTSTDLYADYLSDRKAARKKWDGKTVRVAGKVVSIERDGSPPYLMLQGETRQGVTEYGVVCLFRVGDRFPDSFGTKVFVIEGRCDGVESDHPTVRLRGCKLVPAP